VSRTFLQAGAAAGTVARSISAYDMKMSDVNYGKAAFGFVCFYFFFRGVCGKFSCPEKKAEDEPYNYTPKTFPC